MPAVVRVKRRIDEEPLSTLVLGRKRRRITETEEEGAVGTSTSSVKPEISTILKFAGTIAEQEHSAVVQQYAKLTKMEAKQLLQQKTNRLANNITEKSRREMMHNIHEQRFQVVNCLRTPLTANDGDEEETQTDTKNYQNNDAENSKMIRNKSSARELTIVDIERQQQPSDQQPQSITAACHNTNGGIEKAIITKEEGVDDNQRHINSESMSEVPNSDMGYVYDLYLLENEEIAANDMDNYYLSVHGFDDLVYCDQNEKMEDDDLSIDSNDENFYGNDYPEDEESAESDDYERDYDNSDYDDDGDVYFRPSRKSKLAKEVKNLSNAVADFILYDDDDDDDDDSDDYNDRGEESFNREAIDGFPGDSSSDEDTDYEQIDKIYIQPLNKSGGSVKGDLHKYL